MLEEFILYTNKMFDEDLKEWKRIEREFVKRLMDWDVLDVEISQWKFPDWDVKLSYIKDWKRECKTFEIKWDKKAETSGNVWIEYMCNWHPSGIYTSKADYIVYKIWDKFYYADRLRFIIELSKCLKQDVIGWDNDKSQMFLIKKEVFTLLTKQI